MRGCGLPAAEAARVILGEALCRQGRADEAARILRETIAYYERTLGATHRDTIRAAETLDRCRE